MWLVCATHVGVAHSNQYATMLQVTPGNCLPKALDEIMAQVTASPTENACKVRVWHLRGEGYYCISALSLTVTIVCVFHPLAL